LQALHATGLDQVMTLPPFEPRYRVLESVARARLPKLRSD